MPSPAAALLTPAAPFTSRRRAVTASLLVGVAHAAAVVAADRTLEYPVAALGRGPAEWAFFVGGVVLVVGVPVFLSLRYGLVVPAGAFVVFAGTSLATALTGPRPEFSTLGGHTVVAGTLYLRNYVQGWYCWLLAFLLAGLVEYAARRDADWLPVPGRRIRRLDGSDRRGALGVAGAVGGAHLLAVVLLAAEWGYFAPDSSFARPLVLLWTLPGAVGLAAVPAYLLSRHRLLAPLAAFAWLFYRVAVVQFLPMPDDALPVYLVGWPVFAAAAAVVGAVEALLRRAVRRFVDPPQAA